MLITPIAKPASTQLVAVDETGSQQMLELGDGLSIVDGVLNSSGGGGGGGSHGRQKTCHHVFWQS